MDHPSETPALLLMTLTQGEGQGGQYSTLLADTCWCRQYQIDILVYFRFISAKLVINC